MTGQFFGSIRGIRKMKSGVYQAVTVGPSYDTRAGHDNRLALVPVVVDKTKARNIMRTAQDMGRAALANPVPHADAEWEVTFQGTVSRDDVARFEARQVEVVPVTVDAADPTERQRFARWWGRNLDAQLEQAGR